MKITEMILSAIIKKGILYEAKNCDMEIELPLAQLDIENPNNIKIKFKAENVILRIEKSDK